MTEGEGPVCVVFDDQGGGEGGVEKPQLMSICDIVLF